MRVCVQIERNGLGKAEIREWGEEAVRLGKWKKRKIETNRERQSEIEVLIKNMLQLFPQEINAEVALLVIKS